MLEAEANNGWTILDYLNEDCWHALLDYVPVSDIIRTERASLRWQGAVLRYLKGVNIHILEERDKRANALNACYLKVSKYDSFMSWTNKLGSSVAVTYCISWDCFKRIRENCPKLETLKLVNMPDCVPEILAPNMDEDFTCLQQLCFKQCPVSDYFISHFIAEKVLKGLEFYHCDLTGHFLKMINLSNLETLIFDKCYGLNTGHMLSVIERLYNLTQLKLTPVEYLLGEKIQLVLDKMLKLERLEVEGDIRTSCLSIEPLCRLTRLKRLRVNFKLGDNSVGAMTRCCKELRTLELLDCEYMTTASAESLARHATRLTALTLSGFFDLLDDDVETIIRGCTELTSLSVSGAVFLTPALPTLAAAAWRATRPALRLRLDLSHTNLRNKEFLDYYEADENEEMNTQYEDMRAKYKNLIVVLEPEIEDMDE